MTAKHMIMLFCLFC